MRAVPAAARVIDLVAFDLDGTLIESSRDLADAVNALVVEYGGAPLGVDEVTGMVGEGAAVLVRRALAAASLDPETPGSLDRFLAHYSAGLTVHTKPYPGIPEALAALRARGATIAVLTNKPQRLSVEILNRLGLAGAFSHVIGGDTAAGRKPDPTGLLEIVRRSGTSPAATILVGDSPIDLATARRAGTRICLARYGFGYRFEPDGFRGDELFVDSPAELVWRL
jgi:phosphoglycolate phosphatase